MAGFKLTLTSDWSDVLVQSKGLTDTFNILCKNPEGIINTLQQTCHDEDNNIKILNVVILYGYHFIIIK